ncbi:Component of the BRCA1-A complex [Mortierella polycephala]|uniref:BRISC and BRCA1-A complex member 1 n=1 Tax=Mortierella polycephala TaxID=41804 RepID=A0A9P6U6K6_9FUNG|nr:Component of the BRCA1-A complex [Mortierella polycephala]
MESPKSLGHSEAKMAPEHIRSPKEKIIFCIDLDHSMDEYFMTGEKLNDTRINRTKQLLKWFIEQKSSWNKDHEFAIVVLGEKAVWHMDFTSDTMLLTHAIDELYTMGRFRSFDTTSLFRAILQNVDLDEDDGSVIRAIMVYTRSDVLPTQPEDEILEVLHSSGRFYFDCVYIHNKNSEVQGSIKPQDIYDRLTDLESVQYPGYFYELARLMKKFTTSMSELLASPTIRPQQEKFSAVMDPPPSVTKHRQELKQQQQYQQQLQHQHQREQQREHSQPQSPPTPKRAEMNKVSDASHIFGSQSPVRSMSHTPPPRPSSIPPVFASPKDGHTSPMRGSKTELLPHSYGAKNGGSGNTGTGSAGSGSGTGMDDAILI